MPHLVQEHIVCEAPSNDALMHDHIYGHTTAPALALELKVRGQVP